MKRFARLNSIVISLFVVACSNGGGDGGSGGSSGGSGGSGAVGGNGGTGGGELAPYHTVAWMYEEADVDDPTHPAGIQARLLRGNDGTLYYAYFKFSASDPSCDIAVFGGGVAPGVNYQLRVAVKGPSDSAWSVEIVPLEAAPGAEHAFASSLYGLDGLVEDQGAGDLVLALAAGAPGLATCGSSDLILARRTGTDTYTFESPAQESAACCSDLDCHGDPACRSGTDVGAWAAIAESPSGDLAVGYTDYHNFWDQDGQTMQGYEFWHESDGITGLRPWDGLGIYSAMVYAGENAVTAYAGYNSTGLWVLLHEGTAGAPADWTDVFEADGVEVGERISLAVASDGTVGLAYHQGSDRYGNDVHDLRYCESTDGGSTWGTCDNVDDTLRKLGYYPSLAYDNENRPLIAYRYCGVDNCENNNDGVRLAWREHSGDWGVTDVHTEATSKSGLYTQLVINPDTNEPVVVFQNQTRGSAFVATGLLD